MGSDEVKEKFAGTNADNAELRRGGTMTVLDVVLDEMADEDKASEEIASDEELMGSSEAGL
jgi:hypothetical protein